MTGWADRVRALVVARAPHPGLAKTRLARTVGDRAAADVAAAALLDTLAACAAAYGPGRRVLALAGDLSGAAREPRLREALAGWTVVPQRGEHLAHRLVAAHGDAGPGPVVQVGMDTPQLTPDLLHQVADGLEQHDAVLGPAADGGWWVLALRDPQGAAALAGVPMSRPTTGRDTRAALEAHGLSVAEAPRLADVDTASDAVAVAAVVPGGAFAQAWRAAAP